VYDDVSRSPASGKSTRKCAPREFSRANAAWTITCTAGKVSVNGWVKDTDADGKAAEVYGTWGDGTNFGTVRAGGEGTKKEFNKSRAGSHVYLYLRVI